MTNPNKTLEAAALDKAKAAYDAFGYPQSSHLGLEAGIRAYLGALPLPLVEGEATMPSAAVLRGLGYAPGDYHIRLSLQKTQGSEAVAWVTADILAAMKRGERAIPGWKRSAEFCIPLYASPPDTDSIRNGVIEEAIAVVKADADSRVEGWVPADRIIAALRSLRSGLV